MLQDGVSHRCACVKLSAKGGGIASFWGTANLREKVSRNMEYRGDGIALLHHMGPLSAQECHLSPGFTSKGRNHPISPHRG